MTSDINSSRPETVIFLHIPKCAGNTLYAALKNQVSDEQMLEIYSVEECNALANRPRQEWDNIRLIAGHISYGIHSANPFPSTYITMLREPIDRVVSLYYFIRKDPKHSMSKTANGMSLEEFAQLKSRPEITNGQTRMLSGRPDVDFLQGHEECTETDLKLAKQHLEEHFRMVGIVEQFDESIALLCATFDQPIPETNRRNVNRTRPEIADISAATRKIIERENQFDLELYDFAKDLFARQIERAGEQYTAALQDIHRQQQAVGEIREGQQKGLFQRLKETFSS